MAGGRGPFRSNTVGFLRRMRMLTVGRSLACAGRFTAVGGELQ
jgi:hypothetical protein